MAEIKTKATLKSVTDFINEFADTDLKKSDSFELLKLMEKVTGEKAVMWGASIIGFGKYHYKSQRSKQEGDWPLIGFSPRKAAISLYVYAGADEQDKILQKLGKFKMGKGCIYIKKLEDIDQKQLEAMMKLSIQFLQKNILQHS
ncbi:MAG TPA: DUF1801 domain-containing protein [Ferruginibacter sp.]|nr:DUF1801 domain-containing protein [Ferruginibacter sp.]HRE63330.1 DUF1801 domain-containing protein [Ferruginibacter sp.]